MGIELTIVPKKGYFATDSCLPRWRIVVIAINRSDRNWILEKICVSENSQERTCKRTLRDEYLRPFFIKGGPELKREGAFVVDIRDEGKIKHPESVKITLFFTSRGGVPTTVSKKITIYRHKTIWLDFPLAGRWIIGNSREDLHCLGSQFGFDLLTMHDLELHDNPKPGRVKLEDYTGLGKPIYSPADGVVVACASGCRDYRITRELPSINPNDTAKMMGNYILLQTPQRYFILLGHLLQNSTQVCEGDAVTTGTFLGKVGNSGNTTAPHLHIEVLENKPDFTQPMNNIFMNASGLPFGFKNVTRIRNGIKTTLSRCVPNKLDLLSV